MAQITTLPSELPCDEDSPTSSNFTVPGLFSEPSIETNCQNVVSKSGFEYEPIKKVCQFSEVREKCPTLCCGIEYKGEGEDSDARFYIGDKADRKTCKFVSKHKNGGAKEDKQKLKRKCIKYPILMKLCSATCSGLEYKPFKTNNRLRRVVKEYCENSESLPSRWNRKFG